jgi:hypothetical protein
MSHHRPSPAVITGYIDYMHSISSLPTIPTRDQYRLSRAAARLPDLIEHTSSSQHRDTVDDLGELCAHGWRAYLDTRQEHGEFLKGARKHLQETSKQLHATQEENLTLKRTCEELKSDHGDVLEEWRRAEEKLDMETRALDAYKRENMVLENEVGRLRHERNDAREETEELRALMKEFVDEFTKYWVQIEGQMQFPNGYLGADEEKSRAPDFIGPEHNGDFFDAVMRALDDVNCPAHHPKVSESSHTCTHNARAVPPNTPQNEMHAVGDAEEHHTQRAKEHHAQHAKEHRPQNATEHRPQHAESLQDVESRLSDLETQIMRLDSFTTAQAETLQELLVALEEECCGSSTSEQSQIEAASEFSEHHIDSVHRAYEPLAELRGGMGGELEDDVHVYGSAEYKNWDEVDAIEAGRCCCGTDTETQASREAFDNFLDELGAQIDKLEREVEILERARKQEYEQFRRVSMKGLPSDYETFCEEDMDNTASYTPSHNLNVSLMRGGSGTHHGEPIQVLSDEYRGLTEDFDRIYDQLLQSTVEACGQTPPSKCTQAWMHVAQILLYRNRYLERQMEESRELDVSLVEDVQWHMNQLAELEETLETIKEERAAALTELGFSKRRLARVAEALESSVPSPFARQSQPSQKETTPNRKLSRVGDDQQHRLTHDSKADPVELPWDPKIDTLSYADLNASGIPDTSFVFYPKSSTVSFPSCVFQFSRHTTLPDIRTTMLYRRHNGLHNNPYGARILEIMIARENLGIDLPDSLNDERVVISVPTVNGKMLADQDVRIKVWETAGHGYDGVREGSGFEGDLIGSKTHQAGTNSNDKNNKITMAEYEREPEGDLIGSRGYGADDVAQGLESLCSCDVCETSEHNGFAAVTNPYAVTAALESSYDGNEDVRVSEQHVCPCTFEENPPVMPEIPHRFMQTSSNPRTKTTYEKLAWDFNDPVNSAFPHPKQHLPHLRGGADSDNGPDDDDDDCDCGYDSDCEGPDHEVSHEDEASEPWISDRKSSEDDDDDDDDDDNDDDDDFEEIEWGLDEQGLHALADGAEELGGLKLRGGDAEELDSELEEGSLSKPTRDLTLGEFLQTTNPPSDHSSHIQKPVLRKPSRRSRLMNRGVRDEGAGMTETWREHLVWVKMHVHSRAGKTKAADTPAPPSSHSFRHTHERLRKPHARRDHHDNGKAPQTPHTSPISQENLSATPHSLRQRLQTLLQAFRFFIKKILNTARAKTPKATPICRTCQLVATPPREPRTTSPLRRTFQSQAHPINAATPPIPLDKPLPATPAHSTHSPDVPPTVAGPSDPENHERMWARWKAEVEKRSDEYDGMALPHSGEWFRRFRDGKENWVPVRG